MKVTKNLTHVVTPINLEAAITEEALKAKIAEAGLTGYAAELDTADRNEDHIQMLALDELLGYAKDAGAGAVLYDVTYFPVADEAEVEYQLGQLAEDLGVDVDSIRALCADAIQEYLELDAQRDVNVPVHNFVEANVGGKAVAWYGVNEYPRLKKIVLAKLIEGGQAAQEAFIKRAVDLQMDFVIA